MNHSSKTFETAYHALNQRQKEAVDAIEGPVIILAGPGTGKTHVLTMRVANILKETDESPENILALTFTEAAAHEMKKRLIGMIGPLGHRVRVHTFHGFCNDLIARNPEEFPEILNAFPATPIDQLLLVREALREGSFEILRPVAAPEYYERPLLSLFSHVKREGIPPEEFAGIIKTQEREFAGIEDLVHETGRWSGQMKGEYRQLERSIAKNKEAARCYEAYENGLRARKLYDYDDMICMVLEKVRTRDDLLASLQERFHYIVADEHQDVNNAQNKVLEYLCQWTTEPNICVVGDEKQAIFRFQGASLENFRRLQQKYPAAKIIRLRENYRSHQRILDAASSLLQEQKESLQAASRSFGEKIALYSFSNERVEWFALRKIIRDELDRGTKSREIAVLCRDNAQVWQILSALRASRIPCVAESAEDAMGDEDVRKLLILLEAVGGFENPETIVKALHVDLMDVDPFVLYQAMHELGRRGGTIHEMLAHPERLSSVTRKDARQLARAGALFGSWRRKSVVSSVPALLEQIIRKSGMVEHLLSLPDAYEKMERVRAFLSAVTTLSKAARTNTLEDMTERLEFLRERGVTIKQNPEESATREGVRILTCHKAKGREFEVVCIPRLTHQAWENKRNTRTFVLPDRMGISQGSEDEERRLLYVALTRAKARVVLSYANANDEGRLQLPSQFIDELDGACVEAKDASSFEREYAASSVSPIETGAPLRFLPDEREFFRNAFASQGFSVTAFNNYLECPWKYVYLNLLRVPRTYTIPQLYGIATHSALRDFFSRLREGAAESELLVSRFRHYIQGEPLLARDVARLLTRGERSLRGYANAYRREWNGNVLCELDLQGLRVEDDILIRGKIDKIEILKNGIEVNVVDYKTRIPLSRNEIEGRTKNSNGNYKRQLVFYRLLMDKYLRDKYHMVSGTLDFVEPTDRGVYKKESFEISIQEVKELVDALRGSAREIREGEFLDKGCGKADCEFCELRALALHTHHAGIPVSRD